MPKKRASDHLELKFQVAARLACPGLNSYSLQEQHVPLTTGPSLQRPLICRRGLFLCTRVHLYLHMTVCLSTQGGRRRRLDVSELEVQVFISSQWELGTELQSSARETNSSPGWASLQTLKLDAFGKGGLTIQLILPWNSLGLQVDLKFMIAQIDKRSLCLAQF